MPELPEVETITNDLKKHLIGWIITDIWTDWPKYFVLSGGAGKVKNVLVGRKISAICRRGKNIIFEFSGDRVMAVHLKMTGSFLLAPVFYKKTSGVHLIFDLKKGARKLKLCFSDTRKFGRIIVGARQFVEARSEISRLGPDALSLTTSDFISRITRRRGRIKTLLLNQEFIAGVGNIYSDEALYLAKIHPLSRVEKIPRAKLKDLFKKLVFVLKKSIKLRGTTRQDYRDLAGKRGGYFEKRLVYARAGEKCPRLCPGYGGQVCGGIIKTIKIGGRTSHFCGKCQILY